MSERDPDDAQGSAAAEARRRTSSQGSVRIAGVVRITTPQRRKDSELELDLELDEAAAAENGSEGHEPISLDVRLPEESDELGHEVADAPEAPAETVEDRLDSGSRPVVRNLDDLSEPGAVDREFDSLDASILAFAELADADLIDSGEGMTRSEEAPDDSLAVEDTRVAEAVGAAPEAESAPPEDLELLEEEDVAEELDLREVESELEHETASAAEALSEAEDELSEDEIEEEPASVEPRRVSTPPPAPIESESGAAREGADDERPKKKRTRAWFETLFNDDYLRTVRPPKPHEVARQCDFIEEALGLEPGGTILDVGCGLGLHAIELTARGYLVVGLDLSLPMLSRAADEAQDRGLRINFLQADMREMSFDGAFDAILCWGTTFGYFEDETNRNVIERLFRALRPGGKLLLDVVNRDHVVQSQPNLVWFEGDGCVCMEETQVNFITSRLTVKRTVILDDGRQRETTYSVRLYSLHELGQLLHNQGFRVARVSGREATPGVFFGSFSPRLIIFAERRRDRGDPTDEVRLSYPGSGGEGG